MNAKEIEQIEQYLNLLLEGNTDLPICDCSSPAISKILDKIRLIGVYLDEIRSFSNALAEGETEHYYRIHNNVYAAPLKSIQSNLRHLAWVAKCVAEGDYKQRIHNMGVLTDAFNTMIDKLEAYSKKMYEQAYTDYLTGVGNRRHYNQIIEELWKNKKDSTIAFIDMDGIKICNDKYGHEEGDRYIIEICNLLQSICKEGEYVFRIGGDEFLMLSTICSERELEKRLENLREVYRMKNLSNNTYKKDFSYGCVAMQVKAGKTPSELLSIADQKMYNEKTIHYLQAYNQVEGLNNQVFVDTNKLDKTGLDSRIFDVFSETAHNRYMYLCNMETNVSRWSKQAVQDFNLPGEYMYDAGNIWLDYIHPEDRDIYLNDVNLLFAGQKKFHDVEYRARNKDGNYVICSCMGGVLKGQNGEPDLFAGTITNHGIVDNIDPVTNLYNVYEFLKTLGRVKNQRIKGTILGIAINQFSEINSAFGYDIGNKALLEFANRLRTVINGKGQAFRLDGAKFALFINESYREEATNLYHKIVAIGKNQIIVENNELTLEISGAALECDKIEVEVSTLLAELQHILNSSKRERLGRLIAYTDKADQELRQEIKILDAVKQSVHNECKGFYLMYQPQVDEKGKLIGVEALLRYKSSEYGIIPPSMFIPFLEKDSCFYKLGLWILKTALLEMKEYLERFPDIEVSVNISYRQIEHYGFRDDVMSILNQTGFPAKNLTLELTEHCQSINPVMLEQDIQFFRAKGIRISADDFGTGYSSLGMLRQLSFDCIKIDQSFIFPILEDKSARTIVEAVVRSAHQMGIEVCIEGVETNDVFVYLQTLRPDYYQGYLFAKPLFLEEIIDFAS